MPLSAPLYYAASVGALHDRDAFVVACGHIFTHCMTIVRSTAMAGQRFGMRESNVGYTDLDQKTLHPIWQPVRRLGVVYALATATYVYGLNSPVIGRGRGIRTPGPLLPKQVLYQAELCPDRRARDRGRAREAYIYRARRSLQSV